MNLRTHFSAGSAHSHVESTNKQIAIHCGSERPERKTKLIQCWVIDDEWVFNEYWMRGLEWENEMKCSLRAT